MGLLDRLFGRSRQQHAAPYQAQGYQQQGYQGPGRYARQPDGKPLPFAPDWKTAVNTNYRFALAGGWQADS